MKITHFMSKNASLDYDQKTQTIYITYKGKVSASSILRVHSWMREVVSQFGFRNVRGTVVDLRGVTTLLFNPVATLQVEGSDHRVSYDFCQLPAAMIVRNAYQEKMLESVGDSDPIFDHIRMVRDMNGAKSFIASCQDPNRHTGLFGVSALFSAPLSAARA